MPLLANSIPDDLVPVADLPESTEPSPPPSQLPADLQPTDWHTLAMAKIQHMNLNPLNAVDASTMIGIYDAHRKVYGTPQEQAAPTYGQQLVGQQQELQQQANAQRGNGSSLLLEALHPSGQVMAGLENTLAPVVGLVSDRGAENIRQHAQTLQDVRGDTDSVGGIVGGIAGSLPVMANPLLAGGIAAGETYHQVKEQKAAGANISGGAEALDVAGQAVLGGAMSYLFGKNINGSLAKTLEQQLATRVPGLIARYGAKAAIGAAINVAQGLASNLLTQQTVNPQQDVTEGSARNAALGGGIEVGLGALHDIRNKPAQAPSTAGAPAEPTPAAPVEAPVQPAVTQAETSAQRQAPAVPDDLQQIYNDFQNPTETPAQQPTPASGQRTYAAEDMMDLLKIQDHGETDLTASRQLLGDHQYELRDVPTDELKTRGSTELKQNQIQEYAKLPAETAPPVVADENGQIINGNRRLEAARLRGDETVKAYVPVKEPMTGTDQTISKTRYEQLTDTSRPLSERVGLDNLIAKGKSLLGDESGRQKMSVDDIVGPGSIYHEEIKPPLQKLAGAARELFRGLRSVFPMETGAGNVDTANTVREHFSRSALDQQKAEVAFEGAKQGFDKLGQHAQWGFQARMDATAPQATPELQTIADEMHRDTNEGRKKLASLGLKAAEAWHEEWWNRLWKDDPSKAATFREQMMGPGKIEGRAGFLKSRSIENWEDALKLGKVPKYDNPVDMFLATRAERQKFIAGFGAMKELVGKGDIKRLGKGAALPDGWERLDPRTAGPLKDLLPGDGIAIAPAGVAKVLTNVVTPSAIGSSKVFRVIMDANNTITQSLLGLSGFHVRKVTQELINLNVARAIESAAHGDAEGAKSSLLQAPKTPIDAIRTGSDIQKIMLGMKQAANPEQTRIIDAMVTGGMRAKGDSVYETQWKGKVVKAINDGGVQGFIRAVGYAPLAANEYLMQKGIFQYVQHAKIFMGYEMARDTLARLDAKNGPAGTPHTELRSEMAKISDHLDNVLGLMVRDNLFWNRTARDLATLSTLSVGWNYGSGRALAGGLYDLGKGSLALARGGKLADVDARRISYLASTATLTALAGAVTTYIATGHGPKTLMDYVYPDTGDKDRKGHAVRMNTGFYTSDWFDFLHNPTETAKNKASPILHDALGLISNKDYQGVEIRHSDDPWYKQAGQIARYLGKSTTPLGVQQLINTIEGGGSESKSVAMKAAALAGFRTAKKSYSMSDAENLFADLKARHYEVGGRTQEQADKGKLVSKLSDDIRNKEPGAGAEFRQALKDGKLQRADAEKVKRQASGPGGFVGDLKDSQLTPDEMMQVWGAATPDERKQIQWVVRGRIGRSESIDPDTRRKYLKQVVADVRGK
jgi:hypothetical protein